MATTEKKMLGAKSPRVGKTKKSNPVTKTYDLLPGHIQQRRVRCGKDNCKCARGEFHSAYYHAWDSDGMRHRKYVRRSDVETMRAACAAHRQLQRQLHAGRVQWRANLQRARELFSFLRKAQEAGL